MRKRKALFRYAVAALLTVAAFVFSLLAFEPYQLGWKAWLYCLGIAVVTPFLVDRALDRWASPRLANALVTIAGIVAIVSVMQLADIRGDLLVQQMTDTGAVASVNGDMPAPPPATEHTFYDRTLGSLRLAMILLAFAIEIGAGIALYEASQLSSATGEDAVALRRELAALRERMIVHAHEVWVLEHAGEAFMHTFWRDFYRSLVNGITRGALHKLLLFALCLGLLTYGRAYAADRMDLVVLLDMSQSVAVKDHDNRAEFDKNVQSITRILATLPAGAKVTVLGITDDSFASPYVIFQAALTNDEGYFKERLAKGRLALTRAWADRSGRLTPQSAQTDILGALLVASELFHKSPSSSRKVLIILSDMRQATRTLDLEHQTMIQVHVALQQIANRKLLADLHGVDISILGADGTGKSVDYWQSLREFWTAYFSRAGADLKTYSILRDLLELGR
jgi:hypothetical protein